MMKNYFYFAICIAFVGCKSNTTTESTSTELQVDSVAVMSAQIDSISALIEDDSLNASFYFDRAALYLKAQSLAPGASDLQTAVKLDSTNSTYWAQLGMLSYAMRESRAAKNSWEKCANLDSRNLDCRLNLAEIYLAVGELKKGQKHLEEILSFDAKNSEALFLTGNYALMEADTLKAISYIQAAINENQDFFKAYDQMGVLYSAKGDLLALDYFNSALRLRPYRYDVHYKVGMFYQNIAAYDEAILAYQRALEVNPEHKTSLHNIAVISIFKGEYQKSLEAFTGAISIDVAYLEAYFGRAYTYELMGEVIKSESDYRTCLMLDPSYEPAIDGLSRIGK